jgi:hypothetical protein
LKFYNFTQFFIVISMPAEILDIKSLWQTFLPIVTICSDYRLVFLLMTWFVAHFDTVCDCTLQYTVTQMLVFTVSFLLLCLVAASSGKPSPSSEFLNCPQLQLWAFNINSSQRLNPSSFLLSGPDCNISAWTLWKMSLLLLLCSLITM